MHFLDELLLLLLFGFDYFFGVVDLVDFSIHFVFVEVILRRIRITTHRLITTLIIGLISLLYLHDLIRALQLILLKKVAPLEPNRVLPQLAKYARLATRHISGTLNTDLSNRRV